MATKTCLCNISSNRERGAVMKKRLIKSTDKKIFGVAGGVADYFDIDPTLVRVGFIASAVCFFPFSVVGYLALAVMMPSPSTTIQASGSAGKLDLRDCE